MADGLRLRHPRTLPDGSFEMEVVAHPGETYALWGATNLVNWSILQTFSCNDVLTLLADPATGNFGRRFYRSLPLPP